MKIIHESKYQDLKYDEKHSLFVYTWKPSTNKMTIEEYKAEILEYFEQLQRYMPKYFLLNIRELDFSITPDVQVWLDTNITAVEMKIVRKKAFILPTEFFTHLSIEQTLEEPHQQQIQRRFFDSMEEAFNWFGISSN